MASSRSGDPELVAPTTPGPVGGVNGPAPRWLARTVNGAAVAAALAVCWVALGQPGRSLAEGTYDCIIAARPADAPEPYWHATVADGSVIEVRRDPVGSGPAVSYPATVRAQEWRGPSSVWLTVDDPEDRGETLRLLCAAVSGK